MQWRTGEICSVMPKASRIQLNGRDLSYLLVRSNQCTGGICKHLETRHKSRLLHRLMHIYVSLCTHVCAIVQLVPCILEEKWMTLFHWLMSFHFFLLNIFSGDGKSYKDWKKSHNISSRISSLVKTFPDKSNYLFVCLFVYVWDFCFTLWYTCTVMDPSMTILQQYHQTLNVDKKWDAKF